ncbi:MAG: hypothetical protein MZW92_46785 [Comamonadaceae bacterium]|nr:hypothetical protein [Comamonadaceae bacterium]
MMNIRNLLAAAVLALAGCADNGAGPIDPGRLDRQRPAIRNADAGRVRRSRAASPAAR